MFCIQYCFWDNWTDEEVLQTEYREMSWPEVQEYIKDLREDGCYHITANNINEEDSEDENYY